MDWFARVIGIPKWLPIHKLSGLMLHRVWYKTLWIIQITSITYQNHQMESNHFIILRIKSIQITLLYANRINENHELIHIISLPRDLKHFQIAFSNRSLVSGLNLNDWSEYWSYFGSTHQGRGGGLCGRMIPPWTSKLLVFKMIQHYVSALALCKIQQMNAFQETSRLFVRIDR